MDLPRLRIEWRRGNAVQVGKALMAPLTPDRRAERAAAILDACRARWRSVPEIDAVSALARDRSLWIRAHDAFDAVRVLALREERRRTHAAYEALLFVAENTAKTLYNASGGPAPFDDDSPWWLAANARSFADAVGDAAAEDEMWNVLTAEAG